MGKKISFLAFLLFILAGCLPKSQNLSLQNSFNTWINQYDIVISSWDEMFAYNDESYFNYIYSDTCGHCLSIKEEVETFAINSSTPFYFVPFTEEIPIGENIEKTIRRTEKNTGTVLNIALNYGGRDEIVNAVKKISKEVSSNKMKIEDITEKIVSDNLYTKSIPDPDLLIRTSGEIRLSGFLLWQLAYTELLFVDKLWPDFDVEDLDKAIDEYGRRTRKFGGN